MVKMSEYFKTKKKKGNCCFLSKVKHVLGCSDGQDAGIFWRRHGNMIFCTTVNYRCFGQELIV